MTLLIYLAGWIILIGGVVIDAWIGDPVLTPFAFVFIEKLAPHTMVSYPMSGNHCLHDQSPYWTGGCTPLA